MNGKVMLKGVPYFSDSQVMELTQAEYDALPASKYTDGILYCIKDDGIVEGDKYAPVIYSLEEREIGVWIDGKPLYQKTIVLPISDFSTTTDGYVLHGIDNIDFPVYAYGFPYAENLNHGQEIVPASATLSNTGINAQWSTAVTYFNRTRLGYFLGSEMLSRLSHFYFTLQYTKTTDVPGSGTWGTDGVPMVHYDGNEKIIGTWFGETLYQKTVVRNNIEMGNHDGVKTEIAHGISNFGNLVALHMSCPYLGVATSDVLHSATDVTKMSVFRVNSTNIYCVDGEVYYGASAERYWYLTIQYTKTS